MEILYIGALCDTKTLNEKQKQEAPYFIAQYLYEKTLCDELNKRPELNIQYISVYHTDYFPKDKLFFFKRRKKTAPFKILGFINFPFLREFSYYVSASAKLIKWAIKHRRNKNKCVYSSLHFTPVSAAIVMWTKLFKIKRVLTLTDLSSFTYREDRVQKMKFYKRMIIKPYIKKTNRLQQSYDAYVLFSAPMNAVVNVYNRPYCVVEGIYNSDNMNFSVPDKKENALAHAGTLSKNVGIQDLLDVHARLKTSAELWLMGAGDMQGEIQHRAQANPHIQYLGFLPKETVFEYLKKARLLVIIRNPQDEYTHYSFPSKLFEYMVSGTPVFISKLKGIPEEYYRYVYSLDTNNPDELAREIDRILSLPNAELEAFGAKARQYILQNKNAAAQTAHIMRLLQGLLEFPKGKCRYS